MLRSNQRLRVTGALVEIRSIPVAAIGLQLFGLNARGLKHHPTSAAVTQARHQSCLSCWGAELIKENSIGARLNRFHRLGVGLCFHNHGRGPGRLLAHGRAMAAEMPPAQAMWFSLSMAASSSPMRWLMPPPQRTAYFSSTTKPRRGLAGVGQDEHPCPGVGPLAQRWLWQCPTAAWPDSRQCVLLPPKPLQVPAAPAGIRPAATAAPSSRSKFDGSPQDQGAETSAAPTGHRRTAPPVWRPNGLDPAGPSTQQPSDHRDRCLPPARSPTQR